MQLSAQALAQITQIVQRPQPTYPAAYTIALQDLQSSYPNATGSDADVLLFLTDAAQINLGSLTPVDVFVRANNLVASELLLGTNITLFGQQEQNSSNAVASAFFGSINGGLVQNFTQIANIDANNGLKALGLGQFPQAWAGAMPDFAQSWFGFTTNTFYDTNLTVTQQVQSILIHEIAIDVTIDEYIGLKSGLSQNSIDNIIQTNVVIDTQFPVVTGLELSAIAIQAGGAAGTHFTQLLNSLSALGASATQAAIGNTETDVQATFGPNPGVDVSDDVLDVGPDVDLNLATPSDPVFDIYVSNQNTPITVSGTASITEDVTFLDSQSVVAIQSPTQYTGTIYGFVAGNKIDLEGQPGYFNSLYFDDATNTEVIGVGDQNINLVFDPSINYGAPGVLFSAEGNGSGVLEIGTNVTAVLSGQSVSDQSISTGVLEVTSGGSASGTVIYSGGTEDVYGADTNATVNDGGYQYVLPGGTATDTLISDPGTQVIDAGGTATGATISGGEQDVYGTANNTTVDSDGLQVVEDGGTANGTTINGGKLELMIGASAGIGPIAFAGSGGTLQIDGSAMPANTILGFAPGDTIDLTGIGTAPNATVGPGNVLAVQGVTLNLDPSLDYSHEDFATAPDGTGGTDITAVPHLPPVTTVPGPETVTAEVATPLTGITVVDADLDIANETLAVALSDGSGLLGATAVSGGTVSGSDSAALTLTGTLSAINAELATLTYTGSALALNDLIDVATSDGQGGSDDHTIPVSINNSLPTAYIDLGTLASGSDDYRLADSPETSDPPGTYINGTLVSTFSSTSSYNYLISFNVAQLSYLSVNAYSITGLFPDIASLNILLGSNVIAIGTQPQSVLDQFSVSAPVLQPNTTYTLDLTGAYGGYGIAGATIEASVSPIDIPPATTVPGPETVVAGVTAPLSGISVADAAPDIANESLTVVLSDQSGLLAATAASGGALSGSDTTSLTLTGGLNAINAELATLTYTGSASASTDTIDVATSDGQGGGDDHKIAVTINPTYSFTTIDDPLDASPGFLGLISTGTDASGLNNEGQIVGSYESLNEGGEAFGAFIYNGGQFTALGGPGGNLNPVEAIGINDDAQIVGAYSNGNGGFLYSGGNYTSINDPNASRGISIPLGINDEGQIVGTYYDGSGTRHGFLYSYGSYTTINDPNAGAGGTVLNGINDEGQVVGTYYDSSNDLHGFLYGGGVYATIDYPSTGNFGTDNGNGTSLNGINDNGQIVGTYESSIGFLYSGGVFTTINDPLATFTLPSRINNSGEVVGTYYNNFETGNYVRNGFLASPTTTTGTLLCFLAGTRVRTPFGEAPVQELRRGDLVLTTAGQAMPVRWIGRQTVSSRFADPLRVLPIRVKANALRENVPSRDLLLSPDHAVLVGDVLIQAGALVNGTSIVRETNVPETFTYYHIELDDHSLILAENTPAETFVDNVDRLGFDNWAEYEALYPDGKLVAEMPYPRAKSHRQVPQAVRAMLAARAAEHAANQHMAA
jgi:autotransporter passenger strand-loop-strand repeat protein/probable HAF family extracellular repeat protein